LWLYKFQETDLCLIHRGPFEQGVMKTLLLLNISAKSAQ